MTLKSSLAGQVGFADEAVWGTAVAPTIFHPLIDESLTQDITRIESDGIIAGARMRRSQQWSAGDVTAGGDIGLELNDQSTGLLLKHMFGGTSLVGPFTPADLTGNGLTVQVGVPDTTTGTVRPKTYAGSKVESWEIGCATGEHATLGLTLAAKHEIRHRSVTDGATTSGSPNITSATAAFSQDDVGKPISGAGIPAATTILSVTSATAAVMSANATATATGVTFTIGLALTAASYASNIKAFTFVGASVTLAGSAFKVNNLTLSGDNGLDTDRRFLGQRHIDEPLEADLRNYSGTLETEYFDNVAYNRFVDGVEAALVIPFVLGTRSLTFTLNVRFDGETPQIGGRGIVGQSLPFTAIGTTTDASAITAVLDDT